MTAKILLQARQQQSELQDEYGIGIDEQVIEKQSSKLSGNKVSLTLNEEGAASQGSFRPFKKLQNSREKQQQIRKSDHDDSDSDSDTDEQLDDCENKPGFYSDEEIVSCQTQVFFLLALERILTCEFFYL